MKHTTKILSAALAALALAATATVYASAAEAPITVTLDGKAIHFPDQKPLIAHDRTLVPIRHIAEAMDFSVEWNPTDNSAVIDGGRVILYIGTNRAILDGEEVTLDVASKLIGDRTMVPIRVVAETLDCTVEWLGESRTVQITRQTDSQTDLWPQLCTSGQFAFDDDPARGFGGCGVLGQTFHEDQYWKWHIKRDANFYAQDDAYDCEVYVDSFDAQTLAEVKDFLKLAYPTGYGEVYDLFLRAVKGELWECLREGVPYLASGTFGTHYIDGREVEIHVAYGLPYAIITINRPGYVNPETPMQMRDEDIAALTAEAKKVYLLKKYGLE